MAAFNLIRPDGAGIDLGSRQHYVAIPEGRGQEEVRSFGCFTCDLDAMGDWLLEHGIKDVAMESTGVYWIPVYESLSARGLKVILVDGRKAQSLSGKKTDVQDCQWIRDLHMHGLLNACHVPDAQILAIRSYWRQRGRLVEQRAQQIQLMQKAMEQMNIQLHKVLRDISGVSGMNIIRAIVLGERDPNKLEALVHRPVKATPEQMRAALQGSWSEHHLFALTQALETFDFFGNCIQTCDQHLEAKLQETTGTEPPEGPNSKPRKNQTTVDLHTQIVELLGVDPTQIDGISDITAMTLIAELGTDLSGFPSAKHFTSYLGQAPRNKITGGRIKSSRTAKVQSRAATTFRLAAQSLHASHCALGAFYRRLKARVGPSKAITATARKIATAYYQLLRHGVLYKDEGAEIYEARFTQQRKRWLTKQAQKLGMTLVPETAA